MQIYVDPKSLRQFRRRALRRYPKEYIEALWGTKNADNTWSIVAFQPIDHEAKRDTVDHDYDDARYGKREGGLIRLGTIHSHPDRTDVSPSEGDWEYFKECGELLSGICAIKKHRHRRRTFIRFYRSRALCDVIGD